MLTPAYEKDFLDAVHQFKDNIPDSPDIVAAGLDMILNSYNCAKTDLTSKGSPALMHIYNGLQLLRSDLSSQSENADPNSFRAVVRRRIDLVLEPTLAHQ